MKKHLILFALLLAAFAAQAQQIPPSLGVSYKAGGGTFFYLDYIQKLTFSGGNLVVTMKDGAQESASIALSDISYMEFYSAGAVDRATVPADIFLWSPVTNELTVRCPAGTAIHIYSPDGRRQLSAIQSVAQSPISLTTLPSGIYIVEVGGKTTKIQHR